MTDYTVEDTIYQMFTTRAFATGIPTTLAGTPVVSAYENDSATQITAGITLGVDHDSVTGMNLLTIVATGANGYESGKDYNMVITTGTVGGVSVVGEVVGTFSLGRSAAAVDLANGTDGLGAIKTETAAILVDTGTTLQAELDGIQADTEDIQTRIGTMTDLGGGADIANNLADMAGGTFSSATDALEAIRNRGDSAWTTGAGGSDRLLMVDTTIATLASQTSFTLTAGSDDNDAYNNCTIVIEDASTATQKAVGLISDYVGATKTVTLKYDPGIFTMAATDKVYILAENALKSTDANRQLDVTATGAAGIDWGNVENPTTAVDLSGTDIQLADTVTTNSDMRGTDSAALAATIGTPAGADIAADIAAAKSDTAAILVDTGTTLPAEHAALPTAAENRAEMDSNSTQLAAMVADTNELQTDLANGGRLDLLIDAIKAKTDNLPSGIAKNVALSNLPFTMVDATDFATPETGLTITGEISQDGGVFAALTNAEAEVGNGVYTIDLTQAEMNADTITLKFTATGAAQRVIVLKTDS